MISRIDLFKNINASTTHYATQKNDERGKNNLFVGGSADDIISNSTDDSIILTGAGNDTVISNGTRNRIESNGGDDKIKLDGNENTVKAFNGNNIIVSKGDKNSIATNNGNNTIQAFGANNEIKAGTGNDNILALGNNNNIDSGDGNNSVVFEGDDINVNAGNGNNYIASLDFAIAEGNYSSFANYLEGKTTTDTTEKLLISSTYDKNVETGRTSTPTTGQDIIKQLPANEQEKLKKIDMNEQVNGKPKYVIARGSKDGVQHIYQYSSEGRYSAIGDNVSGAGDRILLVKDSDLIKTAGERITTVTTQDYVTNTYADVKKMTVNGNKNIKVTTKDGNNTIHLNHDGLNLQTGDGNNNILAYNGIELEVEKSNQRSERIKNGKEKQSTTTETFQSVTVAGGSSSTYDPLIIDFNQDGKISAQNGKGVDIDGDGAADGAATGGDKMLAMSDINGNGKIGGKEVFGDKTVNPFTGKKLNAANGFTALKLMAESAQAHTGINCIDANGLVDLKALDKALQTKGIKLGFVSDENDSQLEELTKVAYINVKDYQDHMQTGSVQQNQSGTSIFEDGTQAIVADAWFTAANAENNPFNFSNLLKVLKK